MPSPTCVIDGATFKKTLVETIHGNMSPEVFFTFFFSFSTVLIFFLAHTRSLFFLQTLNDVTELYTKYAAGNIDSAPQTAQNIIIDVINYFHQRAQRDKIASTSNDDIPNDQKDTRCNMDGNLPVGEDLPADGGAHVDVEGNGEASAAHDDCSGNTVIITPSSGDCSSAPESITEIVKV